MIYLPLLYIYTKSVSLLAIPNKKVLEYPYE